MHKEELVGSIEIGKRADLIVLDRDLFEVPAAEINEANVVPTLFDGRPVYNDGIFSAETSSNVQSSDQERRPES